MKITPVVRDLARLHLDPVYGVEVAHAREWSDISLGAREAMASCEALAPHVEFALARDPQPWVRHRVACRSTAPEYVLRMLALDVEHMVSAAAVRTLHAISGRRMAAMVADPELHGRTESDPTAAPMPEDEPTLATQVREWLSTTSPCDAYALYAAYVAWCHAGHVTPAPMIDLMLTLSRVATSPMCIGDHR